MKPRGRPSKVADQTRPPSHIRRLLAALIRIQRRVLKKLLKRSPETGETPAHSMFAFVDYREWIATILLTIPSAGAMLLTYRGVSIPLSENGAEIAHKGDALVFAAAIGALVWLGWFFLFSMLHRLSGRRLKSALVAGSIYVTIVASIDAPFNMLALGGAPAVQMSLVDTGSYYEAVRTSAFAKTTVSRRLIASLRTQAASFRDSEEKELGGVHSGQPKAGKVSAAFGQVATLLNRLADELEKGLASADGMQSDITTSLARIKKAAHEQGPIRARVETVSTEADKIDELLGRLVQLDMSVSIKATLKSLETAVPVPTKAVKPFEVVQNEQLVLIAERARTVAGTLQQALAELPTASVSVSKPVRPLDAMTAIKTYWRPLLPQWIAAFFVDLAPGLLLFILIAGRREAEHIESITVPTVGAAS